MARKVNEEEYTTRRNEILDAARTLVYTKGYEQMSIQDILNALKISKGAFYHYFDSKPALLEALIDRFADEAEQAVSPILQDPNLTALEKLQHYFSTAVQWKVAQKDYLLAILRVWYSDDNAIIRQKVFVRLLKRFSPSFVPVIQEGIQDGSLSTAYPEQVMQIVFQAIQGLGDKFGEAILTARAGGGEGSLEERILTIEKDVVAYTDSVERILGAQKGSIQLMDAKSVRMWLE
jgi:TetR/AcrR family transcriptional repressor of nem operon